MNAWSSYLAELRMILHQAAPPAERIRSQLRDHEYFIGNVVFRPKTFRRCGREPEARIVISMTEHYDDFVTDAPAFCQTFVNEQRAYAVPLMIG